MADFIRRLKDIERNKLKRQAIYECLIPPMQEADWDCESECCGDDPAYEAALRKLQPGYFES